MQNKLLNCFIYHLCWIKLPSFEQSRTNPLIVRHLLLLHPAYLLPVNILMIRKKLRSPLFSSNQLTPPRSLTRTRSLRSWKTRPRWSCWGYVYPCVLLNSPFLGLATIALEKWSVGYKWHMLLFQHRTLGWWKDCSFNMRLWLVWCPVQLGYMCRFPS